MDPSADPFDARLGGLLRRAVAGEHGAVLVEEIESTLSEGYMLALRADADRRRARDGAAAERAVALRGRLAELRRHYVRLAGLRTDLV